MKKYLLILLAMVMVITLFAGCGGNADQTPGTSDDVGSSNDGSDGQGSPLELTFYYPVNVGGSATALIDQICADFNKEHQDIIINPVYTGNYDDTVTKIQTAIQGGAPPDVFISLATQRFTMESTGMAMPLNDFIEANGQEGEDYINDFLPSFMEDSYVGEKIMSIPFQRSTMVLYYNKEAFEEVGLDPEKAPENWDQMVEFSKKLTKDGRYGVGIALNSGSAQWAFTGFALQNSTDGRNLMSEDGKEVYFNTPENVEALQLWIDLQNKHKSMAPGIVQWTDLPTQFLSGEVAMIYHTTGNMGNISENATFDFGTSFLPAGKRVAAPTGGGNFYITSGISEERQQAAWEFIKFATSTEKAAQWSLDTGYVPTRQSCFETDMIKDYYSELPQASVAYEQLPYAKPELTTYNAAEIWRILNDHIQAAITGDMTAAEALEAAQEAATEVLSEYQ